MGVGKAILESLDISVEQDSTKQRPAISVDNLTHEYISGQTLSRVLHGANLSVSPGESVALIGRSGSGKSTLLNLISGLEPLSNGEVKINGHSLKPMNDNQRTLLRGRHIGFIYQAFNLIPTLSVKDNVALPLALMRTPQPLQTARVNFLLDAVGLGHRADDYPDRLSGGEQQRIAIARALAHEPALILADEPTGNLDAESGRQVLSLLTQLVNAQSSAMLLVTHSSEVARAADHVLMLDNGKIEHLNSETMEQNATW